MSTNGTHPVYFLEHDLSSPYIEVVMVPLSSPTFLLMSTWKIHPCCNEPFRWVQGWIRRGSSAQWQLYLVTWAHFWIPFQKHMRYLLWTSMSASSNLRDSTTITFRGLVLFYSITLIPHMSFGVSFDTDWQPKWSTSFFMYAQVMLWLQRSLTQCLFIL